MLPKLDFNRKFYLVAEPEVEVEFIGQSAITNNFCFMDVRNKTIYITDQYGKRPVYSTQLVMNRPPVVTTQYSPIYLNNASTLLFDTIEEAMEWSQDKETNPVVAILTRISHDGVFKKYSIKGVMQE